MNPMHYNGGALIAMVGKDCVAIATDRRFGIQAMTLATDFPKVFTVNDHVMFGLAGLATDVQTMHEKLRFRTNLYKLREERDISPKTFAHLVSSTLYERRFGPYFVEPVIAGLESDGTPFIASTDLIGCINFAKDFVVIGTAGPQLYGVCESFWEPNLEPEALFEVISQALLNAVDRDAISGWGADVYILTKDQVIKRTLKGRMD
ncbi:nucleophile aminohydrolase [Polychytrium aggregatum]|uniref:nucleophile aminohydrolase n=1 Tax=Polychytrium aggregatum TaxID=110093 RepID=UPI0022FE8569|nr:nucleophile aminohydrolase [Polychytrium aggregatum]KAI9206864.1 nucleophile aminohydrolase [Polychytrium aggregatum]